jgi:hypothetical protein
MIIVIYLFTGDFAFPKSKAEEQKRCLKDLAGHFEDRKTIDSFWAE